MTSGLTRLVPPFQRCTSPSVVINAKDEKGGDLVDVKVLVDGAPLAEVTERPLHQTSRMAHCAAIGVLLGRPGAYDLLDHAMDTLWRKHRDAVHGGFFWSFDASGARVEAG